MSEAVAIIPIQSIVELTNINLPKLEKGKELGDKYLTDLLATKITNDIEREDFVAKMVGIRKVGDRMKQLRMEISRPLDEIKTQLMSFERDLDDASKSNRFAQAKQILTDYDQVKLEANRQKEADAERMRQLTIYKSELNAAAGRACIEMLAGQERNLIAGMAKWEADMTLENFVEKEKQINADTSPQLKMDKYDACFNLNFNRKNFMTEEETKQFIEGLKLIYPYDLYNKKYIQITAEIKNSYRAKMPSIKAQLIEAQKNKEVEAQRQAAIKAQEELNLKASEEAANKEVQEVVNQKDLTAVEANFQKQGQLADVQSGPVKYEASFANDSLWLKPFLAIIQVVAASGKVVVKKANGEYATQIAWWQKAYAAMGKPDQPIDGIVLKEVAKTILKEKKTEE